jgi:hypothetical protein
LASRSKEFDELADNTSLSQHGDAGQDQIGSSGLRRQVTRKFETNNLRKNHRYGLSKHNRLCLNTAYTPSDNAETVDHGSMRVGSND